MTLPDIILNDSEGQTDDKRALCRTVELHARQMFDQIVS